MRCEDISVTTRVNMVQSMKHVYFKLVFVWYEWDLISAPLEECFSIWTAYFETLNLYTAVYHWVSPWVMPLHIGCILLRQNKQKHSILMTSICPESRHCFQMVRLYTKCSIKTSIVNLQLTLSAIYANYTKSGVESPFRSDAWILGRLTSSGWKFSAWITDASLGRLGSTQHEVAVFTAYVLLITTKLASLSEISLLLE